MDEESIREFAFNYFPTAAWGIKGDCPFGKQNVRGHRFWISSPKMDGEAIREFAFNYFL